MKPEITRALEADRLIDITTTGKRTGKRHRIEIAFHNHAGRIFISGMPGKRDWYANLVANPDFTFHLKQSVQADLSAKAVPITDPAARRQVLSRVVEKWGRQNQLEAFVQGSPLVEVEFAGS